MKRATNMKESASTHRAVFSRRSRTKAEALSIFHLRRRTIQTLSIPRIPAAVAPGRTKSDKKIGRTTPCQTKSVCNKMNLLRWLVGRVTPCAPLQLQPKRRARSGALYGKTVLIGALKPRPKKNYQTNPF